MPDVIVLQHEPFETLGTIEDSIHPRGISSAYIRPFGGERTPSEPGDAKALIVLGGTMGVYEQQRFPFLTDEIRLIEQALKNDLPILGICLGSQLLASALGADVYKAARKEIGWIPVSFTAAARTDSVFGEIASPINAFHWHGDIFDLPAGAEPLAFSQLTKCQAYRYSENAYGLLFHPEVTHEIIVSMIESGASELKEEELSGRRILEETDQCLKAFQKTAAVIWDRWAALISQERATL